MVVVGITLPVMTEGTIIVMTMMILTMVMSTTRMMMVVMTTTTMMKMMTIMKTMTMTMMLTLMVMLTAVAAFAHIYPVSVGPHHNLSGNTDLLLTESPPTLGTHLRF